MPHSVSGGLYLSVDLNLLLGIYYFPLHNIIMWEFQPLWMLIYILFRIPKTPAPFFVETKNQTTGKPSLSEDTTETFEENSLYCPARSTECTRASTTTIATRFSDYQHLNRLLSSTSHPHDLRTNFKGRMSLPIFGKYHSPLSQI